MAEAAPAERERKILVAVDQGDESMYALSWCLKNLICQDSNDSLILLYAKPAPRVAYSSVFDGTGYIFSSDTLGAMEKYWSDVADCIMTSAKKICRDHVKTETIIAEGDARDVICEMAEKLNPDVLVMGSHGYGLIKRALLGSVSNHCAQNVKCPVLIVKRPKSPVGRN